jgi:hypothetical protein
MRIAAGRPAAGALVIALAVAWLGVGAWLRLSQFGAQIVIEDEWHALHKIVESGARAIFTSFGSNDYSIPLALYDRWLMARDALTEWTLKAPMLAGGLLLVAGAPFLVIGATDRATRALWVGLLAVSPLLVYFTNTARPYAITAPATLVAVIGVRRWWQGGGRRWAAAYVVATWLAGWLHPITLGFTLLPLAYFGLGALRTALTARDFGPLGRLVALATIVVALLAPVLGPPLYYDWSALAEKAGWHTATWDSAYRALLLLAGTASPVALAAVLALAAIGVAALARRDAGGVAYVSTLIALFALMVGATHAIWIGHPLVQARYVLPALPFLLLATAAGAVALARRIGGEPAVVAAVIAVPAALLLAGPLPRMLNAPNQFVGHMRWQFDYDDARNPYVTLVPPTPFPAFYDEMAKRPPGSVTLVEMPWSHESQFNPLPFYQQRHRQRVRIGLETGVCGERAMGEYPATASGINLANFVHLSSLLDGRDRDADYLVVHKTLWAIPAGNTRPWPDMQACLPTIAARFGAPVFEDPDIVVFALKR